VSSIRSAARRLVLILAVLAVFATFAPVTSAAPQTEYDKVYAVLHSKLGDKWVHRATGPNTFDCSGLVWFGFHENDLQSHIGGYRSVAGYVNWFKQRGLMSKTNPQLGDLVVWGANQHVGFYIGNGMAISALVTKSGVSIHKVKGYLGIRFKAYLHTHLTHP
jgi:cell wall-associated NlpC family hydrolase